MNIQFDTQHVAYHHCQISHRLSCILRRQVLGVEGRECWQGPVGVFLADLALPHPTPSADCQGGQRSAKREAILDKQAGRVPFETLGQTKAFDQLFGIVTNRLDGRTGKLVGKHVEGDSIA